MNSLFKSRDSTEVLPLEDGVVSATQLPADEAASKIAYETATFGLG